jgi:hypothetical protein
MMARILHKRSATTGVVPSATELDLGEMAVNTADGKVFIKKTSGVVVEVGGAGVSSGTVTSVAAGTGLTGGTITNTGTLAVDFASSGTSSASKAVRADDSRLSDSRIPTAHTHATSDLTQSGASTGQVLGWSGSAWGPQTLPAPMQPIIKPFSTFKVCGGNNCPTMTTQPHAADQIRLYAAVWPFSFTVDAISAVVTTASASGNIRAALYGADVHGRPNGAPLLSMVGQSAATTGEKITTGLSYTIQANTIYWLGIQSGGASVTVRAHPTTSLYPLHANPASTSNYTSVLISASYASGLPTITGSSLSTLASYVSSACGAVYLRAT